MNILEQILLNGIYTRSVIRDDTGKITYVGPDLHRLKIPILRNIDNEICIQSMSRVDTKWMHYKLSDQNISWAFNKEDFIDLDLILNKQELAA